PLVSCTISRTPAFARLLAMGKPMVPSPMNPTVSFMRGSSGTCESRGASAAERLARATIDFELATAEVQSRRSRGRVTEPWPAHLGRPRATGKRATTSVRDGAHARPPRPPRAQYFSGTYLYG